MSEHLNEVQRGLPAGYRCNYVSATGKYVVKSDGAIVLTRTVEEVRRWRGPKGRVMASAIRFAERAARRKGKR